jgi:hypothetical protein
LFGGGARFRSFLFIAWPWLAHRLLLRDAVGYRKDRAFPKVSHQGLRTGLRRDAFVQVQRDSTHSTLPNRSPVTSAGCRARGFYIYLGDSQSGTYSVTTDPPTTWSTMPPLPSRPALLNVLTGSVYLQYDAAHHILYSSNFQGGTWVVTQ